jgi:hypothetical protein
MSEARDNPSSQDYSRASHQEALGGARNIGARASVVNRTHRVVRERATMLAVRRSRIRSLWVPLAICSSLFVIICTAVWNVLDAYEVTPNGVPDASNQFLVLCLWFLPVSMALLALVLFRRTRKREVAG